MDIDQNTIIGEMTLGKRLRQRREELGLSIEQVAKETFLQKKILINLENDHFRIDSYAPSLVEGYVRSYAKFLRLSSEELKKYPVNYGNSVKNNLSKNAISDKKINSYNHYSRWILRFTWIILLLMGVMTFYYWWQNYRITQQEREELISGLSTDHSSTKQSETQSLVSNTQSQEQLNQSISNTEVVEDTSALNTQIEDKGINAVGSVSNDNTTVVGQSDTVLAQSTPPEEASEHQLVIKITGESCWLSVKGKNNRVLAEKEYKQGEILTFNDNESYSLVIGAPRNVSVTYLGKAVELRLDGRVARFSLPN